MTEVKQLTLNLNMPENSDLNNSDDTYNFFDDSHASTSKENQKTIGGVSL